MLPKLVDFRPDMPVELLKASDIVNGIRFSTTCKLHATKCKPHRELAQEDVVSKVSHSMIVNFIALWSRPAVQNLKTVPP